jgi:hypothetical protein
MNTPHSQALAEFSRKLAILLMLRKAVLWTAIWMFVWGVVVLAVRMSGISGSDWLVWGVLGFAPIAIVAALIERQRLPSLSAVRANYDRLKECGGVVMSEEAADMSAWQGQVGNAGPPALRWKGGRSMGLFGLSGIFVAVALLLPERFTAIAAHRPLEIGQLVEELQVEVEVLEEEKILEENKAVELEKQLSQMREESSGLDPNKTWEALDHIKQANADAAKQAAEEALNKLTSLTQAEALASALQMAVDTGLNSEVATSAAIDLASMLKSAKLEEGLLKGEIPPELLSQLNSADKEQLQKLLSSIQFNKNNLSKTAGKLAQLRLIDPKKLSECKSAGECPNVSALATYLCQNTNGCSSYSALAMSYCRGGVNRGRGDAPMTWTDGSDENGAKFKEEALPPSTRFEDAQLVGLNQTAPELSGDEVVAGHGALNGAAASGGSAHSQTILPRHKQTVQRFFKRDE